MSVLNKVRRWIDGDSAETVLEEAARDAQVKPRSIAEEFIVKLARAVEEVMQREMVPLPQGTTLIPTEYIIFLSEEDDKEWQGVKRRGLEQGLYHVLSERAKEISGRKKLETQSFAVELRIDGTLEKGDIRVQHGWDEAAETQKTGVIARGKPVLPSEIAKQAPPVQPFQQIPQAPGIVSQQPPPTVPQVSLPPAVSAYPNVPDSEEMTHLHSRKVELYKLEIWHGGVRQNVIPIYQHQVSVGRGSKSKPVDITLAGDPEISRRHLTIGCEGNSFWVVSEGRNSTLVSNRELNSGLKIPLNPGEPITVCSYLLRIQKN